jgi:hypothetical protein
MKSRIAHTSYVIDFLDVDFSSDEISDILKSETDEILKKFDNDRLIDWELLYRGIYGKGTSVCVFTNVSPYVEDKQKQITVHIPIPTNDVAEWGIDPGKLISLGKPPSEFKGAKLLDVEFKDFSNRTDYILDCFRRAIKLSLAEGFTINKIKIKIT